MIACQHAIGQVGLVGIGFVGSFGRFAVLRLQFGPVVPEKLL